jgi:hypothetical protein
MATIDTAIQANPVSYLYVESWGDGAPVVLVHGSLAIGAEEWEAQRALADEGFRLLVPDRRGHGQSPAAEGEDFLRDAEDIAKLMGDGAHLVGHSYGGLGGLFAFLKAVGSDPDEFPPDFLAAALPLVPVFRRGRPIWYPDLPIAELAGASFPKLVVSGGHSAGYEAICDDLAGRIGAVRKVVEGAGHEIQFTGRPINEVLLELWRTAA